jgi:hypothetical protein
MQNFDYYGNHIEQDYEDISFTSEPYTDGSMMLKTTAVKFKNELCYFISGTQILNFVAEYAILIEKGAQQEWALKQLRKKYEVQ